MRLPELLRGTSFRLAVVHALLFALAVTALFAVVYWSTASSISQNLDREIEAELDALVGEASDEGLQGVSETIARRMEGATASGDYLLLQDADGHPIVGNLAPVSVEGRWFNIRPQRDPVTGRRHKEHVIRAKGRVLADGSFVVVGQDTYPLRQLHEIIVRGFATCLVATIALALTVGGLMSARVARRLRSINSATEKIVRSDMSRRLPFRNVGGDEFDQLAKHINAMSDQIQQLVEDLQQVTNDIAHDLRTPLTRLRQRLELAKLTAQDPAEYEAVIDQAMDDSTVLLETFTAMLRIAQIESGTRRAGFTDLSLSEVLESLVEIYGPVAEDSGHVLTSRITPGVRVTGDRELLTQLFVNLIENSIKHTPGGARVEVILELQGARALAAVADNGPGIPEPMQEHALRRFVRLEASRTTAGNGLGLSLVAAIAELHGVQLELGDNSPGLRVSLPFITLPARRHASLGTAASAAR